VPASLAKREKKPKRRDPREAQFIENFFLTGETRGKVREAAVRAGYDEEKAESVGRRILKQYDKEPFRKSLTAAGLTKPQLALMLKDNIDNATSREFGPLLRVALKVQGELSDTPTQPTVNVMGEGAQVLIVQGMDEAKRNRLKKGAQAAQLEAGNAND